MHGPLAIHDMVLQQRFAPEAVLLEQLDRAALIGRHLRHELLEFPLLGGREHLRQQPPADALAAELRRNQQPNLAHMRRPAERIADEGTGADDRIAILRHETVDEAVFRRLQPGLDDAAMLEIAAEEQQVVLRLRAREALHGIRVLGPEAADGDGQVGHVERS